ncbi:unnamed protein product [Rhizoctonia solani]|nr:unnamed protein product [Rhizoctonia solani]
MALIPYSNIMFRVLLVVWCVVSYRPFHTVADQLFFNIVHMLWPDAVVPTPHTLSSDLLYIFGLATTRIRDTFLQMETGAHLAIDGWSSPLTASFLGVVVFWRSGSTMWRSVLDFIHLTHSHTGAYLAEKTLECLDRFGLRHHIVSAFMSVFSCPASKKRKLAANARAMNKQSVLNNSTARSAAGPSTAETAEFDDPALPSIDALDTALEVPGELVDEGMEQHNAIEVQTAVGAAIKGMLDLFGLQLSDSELKEAREVFPKASGFANRIHASGTLQAAFAERRNACKDLLSTQKEMPTQQVATRWGSAAACGRTHEELRMVVEMMTSNTTHKLGECQMSMPQWDILEDVNKCLEVFDEPTHVHSQKGVPLIHLAIPDMHTLKFRLELMRDGAVINPRTGQPPRLVIRVAAYAALNVLNKYLRLLEASDIYWLVIALCPWNKLQWFVDRNYPAIRIQQVGRLLEDRFGEYTAQYAPPPAPESTHTAEGSSNPSSLSTRPHRLWMQTLPSTSDWNSTAMATAPPPTALSIYLATPLVCEAEINKHGALLQFWENEAKAGSVLGRLALDILTAPSSSVDVERAFSGGRMSVNYRQHRTSLATFRAKMAVGSWFGTPLLPDVAEVLEMVEGKGDTESGPPDLD